MVMTNKGFEKSIKQSFENVKKDISALKGENRLLRSIILQQNKIIKEISEKMASFIEKEEFLPPLTEKDSFFEDLTDLASSSGNIGVKQTNKQTNKQALSKQTNNLHSKGDLKAFQDSDVKHTLSTHQALKHTTFDPKSKPKPNFEAYNRIFKSIFQPISKQLLKVFLTIYQLEDEGNEVSYRSLAKQMGLSEECIRGYIAKLIKKEVPINKTKIDNKMVLITIDKGFRELDLKQRLINLYYEKDPAQRDLFESF